MTTDNILPPDIGRCPDCGNQIVSVTSIFDGRRCKFIIKCENCGKVNEKWA